MSDRRKILKMIIFFKICRNLTPTYLNRNLNPINNIVSNYTLRNTNCRSITPYKCRLAKYQTSFFPNSTRLWNSLPYSVQNSENVSTFKNRLKQYFEQERNVRSPLKLEHFHDGFFRLTSYSNQTQTKPPKSAAFPLQFNR